PKHTWGPTGPLWSSSNFFFSYQPYSVPHAGMSAMAISSRPSPYQSTAPPGYVSSGAGAPFNVNGSGIGNSADGDDWYSRSLNALRMPSSHGFGAPMLHYQT